MNPIQFPTKNLLLISSTTSFLNATNLTYASRDGITAAAGTILALYYNMYCFISTQLFNLKSIRWQIEIILPTLSHLVTTSIETNVSYIIRVICAPAVFLRCGSRVSGCLSGIEPRFPVTRHNLGSLLHYQLVDRSESH